MRKIIIAMLLPLTLIAQKKEIDLKIDKNRFNDIQLNKNSDEIYDILTTGIDGYIYTVPLEKPVTQSKSILSFEYFCPTGINFIQLYFYPLQTNFSPKTIRDIGSTEGWVEFAVDISEDIKNWGKKDDFLRIDFSNISGLSIQIRNLKIRAPSEREKEIAKKKSKSKAQQLLLETHLADYLQRKFESEITKVLVKKEEIIISGTSPLKNLFLAEVSIYENLTELKNFEFTTPIHTKNSVFEIKVKRFINRDGFTQDRLFSKWVLINKKQNSFNLVSNAKYQDSVVPKYTYPFVKPSTKKGLGDLNIKRDAQISDLRDLNISSVTVNIWINNLFRSKPSNDNLSFDYMGKSYYVNKTNLENLDGTLKSAAKRNIEVSAILLVSKAKQSPDKTIGEILQHPDCDPAGIYSMPNVTSPMGVQYYAAILDFLAKRYSKPDKQHGRIHHWIIHNEIDAGWVWTNAGDKRALVFMDLYHKSMRMSYNIARMYNPNSKVFISLTHYWNWTSNKKFYHSKDMLEKLLSFSKVEGDFEWAVAHHPYPESLREPKTWLDKKVSYNFDTKLITFKNIEVLDAWIKQPNVLYKEQYKRTVYLSENGTNSPSYSELDLKEQAAGMAYALKKIKYLDGIDGFQYHNWQDNRKEGGLRIGLRRYPDDEEKPGAKKPVWYVYEAFETKQENRVFDQYKELIGIEHWSEIRYTEQITK